MKKKKKENIPSKKNPQTKNPVRTSCEQSKVLNETILHLYMPIPMIESIPLTLHSRSSRVFFE